jgi:hypothetical protein
VAPSAKPLALPHFVHFPEAYASDMTRLALVTWTLQFVWAEMPAKVQQTEPGGFASAGENGRSEGRAARGGFFTARSGARGDTFRITNRTSDSISMGDYLIRSRI